jgi:ABC-2 type transport system ATP-binding protein
MAEALFSAASVECGFPRLRLRALSCTFYSGQCVLLLGSNGAGKSSFLDLVSGLLRPDRGSVNHFGRVALAAHTSFLYEQLSVAENLRLYADLRGISHAALNKEVERWDLATIMQRREAELSQGQRARVVLARTFMDTDSSIWCFDEPSSSLDEKYSERFIACLHEAKREQRLIFLATHDITRLAMLGTHVVVMQRGTILIQETCSASSQTLENALTVYRENNR